MHQLFPAIKFTFFSPFWLSGELWKVHCMRWWISPSFAHIRWILTPTRYYKFATKKTKLMITNYGLVALYLNIFRCALLRVVFIAVGCWFHHSTGCCDSTSRKRAEHERMKNTPNCIYDNSFRDLLGLLSLRFRAIIKRECNKKQFLSFSCYNTLR